MAVVVPRGELEPGPLLGVEPEAVCPCIALLALRTAPGPGSGSGPAPG
ncbi:hypothetical protein ABZ626_36955 [Streptomyces longispororuber]